MPMTKPTFHNPFMGNEIFYKLECSRISPQEARTRFDDMVKRLIQSPEWSDKNMNTTWFMVNDFRQQIDNYQTQKNPDSKE